MSLLSKMMRIAGRDPAGNAKALQTDADGYLKTHAKQEEVVVAGAGSIAAAGNSGSLEVYAKGANLILLSLKINKGPWSLSLHKRWPWAREGFGAADDASTYPDVSQQFLTDPPLGHGTCVFMPIMRWDNLDTPLSFQEALKIRYLPDTLPGDRELEIYIYNNHSTDAADYELLLFRSWRAF